MVAIATKNRKIEFGCRETTVSGGRVVKGRAQPGLDLYMRSVISITAGVALPSGLLFSDVECLLFSSPP